MPCEIIKPSIHSGQILSQNGAFLPLSSQFIKQPLPHFGKAREIPLSNGSRRVILIIIIFSYAQRALARSSGGARTVGASHRLLSRSGCSLVINLDRCGSRMVTRSAPRDRFVVTVCGGFGALSRDRVTTPPAARFAVPSSSRIVASPSNRFVTP